MTEPQKGNLFILAEMLLWSLFPIVSLLGLSGMAGMTSLFWVNLFATLFFLVLVLYRGKWKELRSKKVWYYTLGVVFFICVMLYGIYFYALPKTTPTNASIIALFEIVPTYIFFHIIRKEVFKKSHILGILLAVIGTLIVLLPNANGVNSGDWLILFAVFFPPIGNWFQQKARQIASAEAILFLRHALSSVVFLVLVFVFGGSLQFDAFKGVFGWLLLNGIFIFGLSKILWVEAIHRMSVTRALAITSVGPIFTALFSWVILGQVPTLVQLLSIPFLVVAVCILTNVKIFNKDKNMKIILGSMSKTRKLVLEEAGIPVDKVMVSDFDEFSIRHDDFAKLPLLLACAKRDALLPKISEPAFLITGDVVLYFDKTLLEKPQSSEEEKEFFKIYDGKNECGFTASITVTNTQTGETREGSDGGTFILGPFTDAERDEFMAQGTYMEYAGGFRYRDPQIFPKMKELNGGEDALMGMPLALTKKFLTELGWKEGK
ncbi:MAG: EamA family transporter [Candidatus Pacebacteria bacterium]|nr:EamA family transporter [Candidatus Paceibacterota bacterium]